MGVWTSSQDLCRFFFAQKMNLKTLFGNHETRDMSSLSYSEKVILQAAVALFQQILSKWCFEPKNGRK